MTRFPWIQAILLFAAMATSFAMGVELPGMLPLPQFSPWPKLIMFVWIAWRWYRFLNAWFKTARPSVESAS